LRIETVLCCDKCKHYNSALDEANCPNCGDVLAVESFIGVWKPTWLNWFKTEWVKTFKTRTLTKCE